MRENSSCKHEISTDNNKIFSRLASVDPNGEATSVPSDPLCIRGGEDLGRDAYSAWIGGIV